LPVAYDIVAFIFLAEWEDGSEVELFHDYMMNLLCIAQTAPEINDVVGVPLEECPEILGYSDSLKLIRMRQ